MVNFVCPSSWCFVFIHLVYESINKHRFSGLYHQRFMFLCNFQNCISSSCMIYIYTKG